MIERIPITRRSFLDHFFAQDSSHPLESKIDKANPQLAEPKRSGISRRKFIQVSSAVTATIVASQIIPESIVAQENVPVSTSDETKNMKAEDGQVIKSEDVNKNQEDLDFTKNLAVAGILAPTLTYGTNKAALFLSRLMDVPEGGYRETIIQQSSQLISKILLNSAFQQIGGIQTGNRTWAKGEFEDFIINRPLQLYLEGAIIAPLAEEIIWRGLPSAILDYFPQNKGKMIWGAGIPITLFFAFIHNLSPDNGSITFTKSIPITQAMGGLNYWYLMREKGFFHVTLAHSYNNAYLFSAAEFFYRTRLFEN